MGMFRRRWVDGTDCGVPVPVVLGSSRFHSAVLSTRSRLRRPLALAEIVTRTPPDPSPLGPANCYPDPQPTGTRSGTLPGSRSHSTKRWEAAQIEFEFPVVFRLNVCYLFSAKAISAKNKFLIGSATGVLVTDRGLASEGEEMKTKKVFAASTAVALTATLGIGALTATSAAAGTNSLADVLTSDNNRFDNNSGDFDVLTEAALAVLGAKPDSPVSVLTDGKVKLTAFAPTDRAFKRLASDLTGEKVRSERKAFKTVASLGIDNVEQVLLYHVIPGQKITAKKALKANGAKLKTAQGKTVKVRVRTNAKHVTSIHLRDKDPDLKNPAVILNKTDINKGNRQIAHAIDRVLLPVNL
jgi:uncharacterized surface protein with fasciclin (FAS1) repeats